MSIINKYWKKIIAGLILFTLGMFIAFLFIPKQHVTVTEKDFEAIEIIKNEYRSKTIHYQDSVEKIIRKKDELMSVQAKSIAAMKAGHKQEIEAIPPDMDTLVLYRNFEEGQNCIELLPLIEAQLCTCQSGLDDFKALVVEKQKYNEFLYSQIDECIMAGKKQSKELKKSERARKANKAWAVIATGGVGAVIIALLVVH